MQLLGLRKESFHQYALSQLPCVSGNQFGLQSSRTLYVMKTQKNVTKVETHCVGTYKIINIIYIIYYLILLNSTSTYSQSNQKGEIKSLPPLPEAAALGKFGSAPISKFTGVPSI